MAALTVNRYASEDKKIPSMPMAAWTIVPSDADVYTQPVMIKCLTAGTLQVIPWEGGMDGDKTVWLSETMSINQVLEYAVRAVKATGITGTYRGIF